MRNLILALALTVAGTGCSHSLVIDGQEYRPYGFANVDERKDPSIEYEVCLGNVWWGVVFSETFIVPALLGAFQIMEPVGKKPVRK